MAQMKTIYNMFRNGCSVCWVAWHILLTTKVSNWSEAKTIAKDLHEEYELTISSGDDIDGNNE
jgi:hypothetical protein